MQVLKLQNCYAVNDILSIILQAYDHYYHVVNFYHLCSNLGGNMLRRAMIIIAL